MIQHYCWPWGGSGNAVTRVKLKILHRRPLRHQGDYEKRVHSYIKSSEISGQAVEEIMTWVIPTMSS